MVVTESRKKKNSVLLQLGIVAVIVTVIVGSFGLNVLGWSQNKQGAPTFFGDFKLVNSMEGEQALAELNQLHNGDIELASGYIAHYSSGQGKVTVWVGAAENAAEATILLQRMVEGISKGGTGFSTPVKLTIPDGYHNHEVYQVQGPGGTQFFYISKKVAERVVWLTLEFEDDSSLLAQAVKTF